MSPEENEFLRGYVLYPRFLHQNEGGKKLQFHHALEFSRFQGKIDLTKLVGAGILFGHKAGRSGIRPRPAAFGARRGRKPFLLKEVCLCADTSCIRAFCIFYKEVLWQ